MRAKWSAWPRWRLGRFDYFSKVFGVLTAARSKELGVGALDKSKQFPVGEFRSG